MNIFVTYPTQIQDSGSFVDGLPLVLDSMISGVFTSTLITAGLLFGILALIGTSWFVLVTLELIPQKWRHWLLFPFAMSLGIGIPYFMLSTGVVEFLTFSFSDSPTPLPVFLLFGMMASMICSMGATTMLGSSRTLHSIEWLQKSFDNKNLPHSNTRGTRYGIIMIYASVALALLSSVGILMSGIEVSSSFYVNYTLLYCIGGGLTYLFSKKITSPVEMIALPSLASGSPYLGIGLWGISRMSSIVGCILFSLGLWLLPNALHFETWYGMIFGLGLDLLLLGTGLFLLKLGDNRGKLRRLRLGLEKINILSKDYVKNTDNRNVQSNPSELEDKKTEEELFVRKEDLEFLNRDI
jgi:hypothetical protein